MTDKNNSSSDDDETLIEKDALVDALESIKGLLAKSDTKLNAARESLATASSSHSRFNALNKNKTDTQTEQAEIPVLKDVVVAAENALFESEMSELIVSEAVAPDSVKSDTSSPQATEIEPETEEIPTLYSTIESPSPEIILNYLDNLQAKLEQTLSDSLLNSIARIEAQLKTSLASEIDILREQIKKDFS